MWRAIPAEIGAAVRSAFAARRGRPSTPWAISFLVTARCGLRCKHCFYHYFKSTPRQELSVAEYDALSRSLGHFPVALFCGGEPFLRPDLADIIKLFRRRNGLGLASATTNGQHTRSVLEQTEAILADDPHKLFMLGISIEGRQEVHDSIRGKGSFAKAIETFEACKVLRRRYKNFSLTTTTVMSTLNQHHTPGFVRWAAKELQPDSHIVLLVRQQPRAGEDMKAVDMRLYRQAQQETQRAMRSGPWYRRFRPDALYLAAVADHISHTRETGVRSFKCFAGVHGALIDPIGRVQVCEVLAEDPDVGHIGNLRDHGMDFGALWQTAEADAARRLVNHHPSCQGCTHETMGHATSLVFPPNFLWRKQRAPAANTVAKDARGVVEVAGGVAEGATQDAAGATAEEVADVATQPCQGTTSPVALAHALNRSAVEPKLVRLRVRP